MTPKLTTKNLKIAQFASEETLCFEATVYVDGQAVCVAGNDGKGGCNHYHAVKGANVNVDTAMKDFALRLDPRSVASHSEAEAENERLGLTREKLGWEGWQKAYEDNKFVGTYEGVFSREVDRAVARADVEKRVKRELAGKLLYTHQEKPGVYGSKRVSKAQLAQWLAKPGLVEELKAKQILNLLPFEEALEIYLKEAAE